MIEEVNYDNFEAFIAQDKLVIVDYFAVWCMPCKMMAPIVEGAAEKFADRVAVGKVDVDACPDLALRFGINSIPCILFFKNGEEVHRVVGLQKEETFYDAIKEFS